MTSETDHKSHSQPSFEQAKDQARSLDVEERKKVAKREDIPKELLYFLASDKKEEVRALVAQNRVTPYQADELLVKDSSERVRISLGHKLARLLPELQSSAHKIVLENTLKLLRDLVLDHALEVRRSVSETLKEVDCLPHDIAFRLAGDVADVVAVPMLRYSQVLTQEDLVTLIKQNASSLRLVAIAQRGNLDETVSSHLMNEAASEAVTILLDEQGNVISQSDLEDAVDESEYIKSYQKPLVKRPELPANLALKMTAFAEEAVLSMLMGRKDYDTQTRQAISKVADRRLKWKKEFNKNNELRLPIREEDLQDAVSWGELDYFVKALSYQTKEHELIIKKILQSKSAKSIVALCWYAGLSMRFAVTVQRKVGLIGPLKIINAREGFNFPLSEEDFAWQLEFFGIETKKSQGNQKVI